MDEENKEPTEVQEPTETAGTEPVEVGETTGTVPVEENPV